MTLRPFGLLFVALVILQASSCSAPRSGTPLPAPAVAPQTMGGGNTASPSPSAPLKVSNSSSSAVTAGQNSSPAPRGTGQSSPAAATNAPKILQAPVVSLSTSGALLGATLEVSVACDQPGAEIRYTLDGTAPGAGQGELYMGPFELKKSAKVQVWAALPGGPAGTAQAFYTVNQIVASPNGTGDGSWNAPIGGLSNAIAKALQTGAKEVCLMAGNYTESAALTQSLTLSGGWMGWQNQTGVTSITAPERGGTSLKDPSSVVKASGTGTLLVLQNLNLTGSDDSFGAAVTTQAGASIVVRNCHLSGGGGSYSYGLRTFHSPLVRIEDSEISGGNGGSTFAVSTDTSTLDLRRSTLDGGTGTAVSYDL
ncbi:MAG: hypothetical protein HKM06_08490 [Spirochaetales bacterium]|nr:hypothetical protein [Spirochaetales bacterium]